MLQKWSFQNLICPVLMRGRDIWYLFYLSDMPGCFEKFICLLPILYKNNGSLTAFHNFESQISFLALVSGILSEWF